MVITEFLYPEQNEDDAYHTLRHKLYFSVGEAQGLITDSRNQGYTNLVSHGPDFQVAVRYNKKSRMFTVVTFTAEHPQYYVFRMPRDFGGLKVWAEVIYGKLHTVIPVMCATRGDAMAQLKRWYPDAMVDKITKYAPDNHRDRRELRVYAELFAGKQIPKDFDWEMFDALDLSTPPSN